MVRTLESQPIKLPEQQVAGPLIREELERLRAENRASMERSRGELDRIERLLLALELHEKARRERTD